MKDSSYLTQAVPYSCPYKPEQQAYNLVAHSSAYMSTKLYSHLVDMGFRRSGERVYKPNCARCDACTPVRIPVNHFKATRTQRRVLEKNRDLRISIHKPKNVEKYYSLFRRYVNERHADSIYMRDPEEVFHQFVLSSWSNTFLVEFRLPNQQLVCISICDRLREGWTAAYTFFDPSFAKRSLGTFSILWQISELQNQGLDYLHLGYWTQGHDKTQYKTNFQPAEQFRQGKWIPLDKNASEPSTLQTSL